MWGNPAAAARCACERPHLVQRQHATWHGRIPNPAPARSVCQHCGGFSHCANCIVSVPALFGRNGVRLNSGRHPRAMALGFSALLVAVVLLAAGSGLPRAAGGRVLAPAPFPSAAAGDRVKSLPEFGKLGALRMYSG